MDFLFSYIVLAEIYVLLGLSTNLLVGIVGIFSVSQAAVFGVGAYLVAHFGPGRLVLASAGPFGLIYALFPFENMLACSTETVAVVWPLIVLQLISMAVSDMGFSEYSCVVLIITDRC